MKKTLLKLFVIAIVASGVLFLTSCGGEGSSKVAEPDTVAATTAAAGLASTGGSGGNSP